jgi:hypothetical protein
MQCNALPWRMVIRETCTAHSACVEMPTYLATEKETELLVQARVSAACCRSGDLSRPWTRGGLSASLRTGMQILECLGSDLTWQWHHEDWGRS